MGHLSRAMNCFDGVFITAVPSGEQLLEPAGAEDFSCGDHRPRGLSSVAFGKESAMATAAQDPAAVPAGQQVLEGQQGGSQEQNPASSTTSSLPGKPTAPTIPSPDSVVVNVAGTRYSVGESFRTTRGLAFKQSITPVLLQCPWLQRSWVW